MSTKNHLLLLETATTNCSVALAVDGQLIHVLEYNEEKYRHSDYLHSFIADLMTATETPFSKLAGVAVSMGPGSYTGLRIGVASAKGICYAQGIPLLAINTLDVLAHAYTPQAGDLLIPMIDARRMEVFTKVLDHHYRTLRPTSAEIISAHTQGTLPIGRKIIFGSGAEKCKPLFTGKDIHFIDDLSLPSAKDMVHFATEKFEQQQFEDVAYFEPFYLKEFYTKAPKSS